MDNSNKNTSKKPERGHSQPAGSIGPDIPDAAAQAELLRGEQLSLERYNYA